ncbi:MAG: hypothetical protein CM1200mP6_09460 [Anaerolineaceae bacterium]|nr:MAG: hypothetical protein CM1200mP6_09460 [Anaerolineaceae bacterium]
MNNKDTKSNNQQGAATNLQTANIETKRSELNEALTKHINNPRVLK